MKMRFVLKGVAVLTLVYANTSGFAMDMYIEAYKRERKAAIAAYYAADVAAYKRELEAATTAHQQAYADMLQELKAERPDNQASEDLYQAAVARWREMKENLRYLGVDATKLAVPPPKFKCSSSQEAAIDTMDRAYAALEQEGDTSYPDKETAERAYQDAYYRWLNAVRRTGYATTGPKWYPRSFRYFRRLPPPDPAPPPVNAPPNN